MSGCHVPYKKDLIQEANVIYTRIEKLEELAKERAHLINFKSYLALEDRIKILEDYTKELEVQINIIRALGGRPFIKDKKPYKCPVCDGKCEFLNETLLPGARLTKRQRQDATGCYDMCMPCEGKGIVWG